MQIGLHPLKKGLKRRVFGGMPLLLLEAQSAGEIAYSRDAPGHIAALHIPPGHGIVVREHQFLAATGNGAATEAPAAPARSIAQSAWWPGSGSVAGWVGPAAPPGASTGAWR